MLTLMFLHLSHLVKHSLPNICFIIVTFSIRVRKRKKCYLLFVLMCNLWGVRFDSTKHYNVYIIFLSLLSFWIEFKHLKIVSNWSNRSREIESLVTDKENFPLCRQNHSWCWRKELHTKPSILHGACITFKSNYSFIYTSSHIHVNLSLEIIIF